MLVSHKALNGRHMTTAFCKQGAESKRHFLAEEETRVEAEMVFIAYMIPLAQVTSFKYLGQILMVADNDLPAVVSNL